MSVVFNIILILASLALIVLVLMQEGNKQGLGAIGGAAETFLGKNKAKSYEGKLLNLTRILAAVFVVLAVLVTWLNARTYTVTYYDENGNEYFPYVATEVGKQQLSAMLQGTTSDVTYDEIYDSIIAQSTADGQMTEEEVRERMRAETAYAKGASITSYSAPAKEGYTGKWVVAEKNADGTLSPTDKELPAEMGRTNYVMMPVYTINSYTLRLVDNGIIEEPAADEETAQAENTESEAAEENADSSEEADEPAEEPVKEDNVIFEVTLNYGETIDYAGKDVLPEVDEYYVFFSTSATAVADGSIYQTKLPETMPGSDTTYYVSYAHGNFVSYFQEQTKYEDVEVEQKDEEGNVVTDEEGNPVMITERQPVVDENGDAVTEEVEIFPEYLNMISSSMVSSWQQTYYADLDLSSAEALQDYINAYAEATGDNGVITQAVNNYYTSTVAALTESDQLDSIRSFVHFGDTLNLYSVAPKDGYIGVWEPEAPETMGADRIELHAKYYLDVTLTVIDDGVDGEKIPVDEEVPAEEETAEEATEENTEEASEPVESEAEPTEEEAVEPEEKHNVVFTFTGAGRTINYGGLELPEAPEGYTVKWSEDLPEIMPEEDVTIYAVYEKAEEETQTEAE